MRKQTDKHSSNLLNWDGCCDWSTLLWSTSFPFAVGNFPQPASSSSAWQFPRMTFDTEYRRGCELLAFHQKCIISWWVLSAAVVGRESKEYEHRLWICQCFFKFTFALRFILCSHSWPRTEHPPRAFLTTSLCEKKLWRMEGGVLKNQPAKSLSYVPHIIYNGPLLVINPR